MGSEKASRHSLESALAGQDKLFKERITIQTAGMQDARRGF
jgi:hypothetical protein